MTTYTISFDTHMGRVHCHVDEAVLMERMSQIMACPGPFNVSVEILDNADEN